MTTCGRLARLLLPGALLAGCASLHGLSPVTIDIGPAVREYKSPELSSFKYVTFSVYPLAAVNPAATLKTEADQRAVLFSVRNLFERDGYRFVKMGENPDFVVGVDASIEFTRGVKRTTVIQAPEWQPGKTLPTPPASLAALAAADTWGWGTMPDPTYAVAQLPGYPPRGRTKPPAAAGRFTATVTLSLLDGKTLAEVWVGTGAGISRTNDVRIASQLVSWMIVHQFPETAMAELTTKGGDLPGLNFEIFTNDGHSFYPGVVRIDDHSQAWKTGILDYDMILGIGGDATWNRPWLEVRRMLTGAPDSKMVLTLWRGATQVNVEGRRVAVGSGADVTAVAAPPLSAADASAPRKQARLEISRTTVAVDKSWAVLGGITIAALVAAVFTAMK
ncbi:MAG: hypothetical protein AAB152_14405 [Candidatus Coatesbacteria bacterium]